MIPLALVLFAVVLLSFLCAYSQRVASSEKDVKQEVLTMVHKITACLVMASVMLLTVAFADEAEEETALPSPSPTLEVAPSLDDEPDAYEGVEEPEPTEEPQEAASPTPEPVSTPEPTTSTQIVFVEVPAMAVEETEPTPTPDPEATQVPVIDDNSYKYQVLTSMGYIQGILIFLAAVVLCHYVYKFFRIFF